MTDERIPPAGTPVSGPIEPVAPDETLIQRRAIREQRVVIPPPDAAGVTPGAVHEEERVGVLSDGSVVREFELVDAS